MQSLGQGVSVTVLRDGAFTIPLDVLRASGAPPDLSGDAPIFAFAVDFGLETWLVDAGAGPCLGSDAGRLPAALDEEGLDVRRITRVLLTHLHPDHVGGLMDDQGRPVFPNAEVILSEREWQDWLSPAARATHDDDAAKVADWAGQALSGYAIRRIGGRADLGRNMMALSAPGHRPGHLAFRLNAGPGVLFVGDILHLPGWQLPQPDWGLTWDDDPVAAGATRRRLLDLAAKEGILVAGAHLGPRGLVHVEALGGGFRALRRP